MAIETGKEGVQVFLAAHSIELSASVNLTVSGFNCFRGSAVVCHVLTEGKTPYNYIPIITSTNEEPRHRDGLSTIV